MPIIRNKLKLSIITSIIIASSFSYANNPVELVDIDPTRFLFDRLSIADINAYPNSQHHHGVIRTRDLNNAYTSKYSTVIINSLSNGNLISFDSGAHFEPLEIKDIDNIKVMSLSNNGIYAAVHGYDNKTKISRLFIYNTILKKVNFLNDKEDINYQKNAYYFTTDDGRFSLYPEYDESYRDIESEHGGYLPYNKIVYSIYDNNKNIRFNLKDLENSDLNNHREKERFKIFQNLDFIDKYVEKKPTVTASTFDGKYLFGSLSRDANYISNTTLAFVYDQAKDKLITLTNSKFGSSKINTVSKNNVFVGWYESWNDHKRILNRQAFFYTPTNDKLTDIKPLFDVNEQISFKANSEATDISDDGNIIVGWSEYNQTRNQYIENESSNSYYLRNAFVYYRDNNKIIALNNRNSGEESEAHSISGDGNVIFGVANDKDNNWKAVIWKLDNNKISERNKNNEKIRIESIQIISENNKDSINKLSQKLELELEKERLQLSLLKNNLENKYKEFKKKLEDTINKRDLMEPLLNENINNYFEKNIHIYTNYDNDITNYKNKVDEIKQKIDSLDHTQESQNIVFLEDQYNQAQIAITKQKEQADKAKAKQERLAKEQADKAKARQERLAKEQADKAKAEQERLAKEQADKAKVEQERLAKEQADKTKARQERLAKEQADKAKAEQERLAKEQADKAKAEQERLAKEQVDKAKAEQERLAKEQADKAKVEQERLAKEQADKAKVEQERLAKEQADKAKAEQERLAEAAKLPTSKPIDIENTYKSMQLMAENSYKLMDIQQGQLRYLASATCSVGTEKACISGFTHYQKLNKANATQTGLSGAYRFDIKNIPLVVGLAIDTDVHSSLPKGYQYQGYALPLIGFSLDLMPSLNAELNSNALHLSLKGAYLNRKVSIERQALADTESGKGDASITGYHIDLQSYYPYSLSDNLLLTPFAGLTFNQISRSAYSETQNAQLVAHYDALKTHSLLAKMGLGMEYLLGSSFILNTKAGLLWSLSHHQDDFRSHIDYIGQQKIDYVDNKKQLKQRPFANVGLTYQFDNQSSVNTSANWEMTTYRNHDMQIGVSYTYRF